MSSQLEPVDVAPLDPEPLGLIDLYFDEVTDFEVGDVIRTICPRKIPPDECGGVAVHRPATAFPQVNL